MKTYERANSTYNGNQVDFVLLDEDAMLQPSDMKIFTNRFPVILLASSNRFSNHIGPCYQFQKNDLSTAFLSEIKDFIFQLVNQKIYSSRHSSSLLPRTFKFDHISPTLAKSDHTENVIRLCFITSICATPIIMAQATNLFSEQGLDVEIRGSRNIQTILNLLEYELVDIIQISFSQLLKAKLIPWHHMNQDLVLLQGLSFNSFALVVSKKVRALSAAARPHPLPRFSRQSHLLSTHRFLHAFRLPLLYPAPPRLFPGFRFNLNRFFLIKKKN